MTHAVQMDATDESALRTLGLRNFDVASNYYRCKYTSKYNGNIIS